MKKSVGTIFTKTQSYLKRPERTCNEQETTWNYLQQARNNLKQPETIDNELEKTWNDLQRADFDINLQ